ncbi:MAG: hypothetical protein KDA37_06680 [Planctomycetales bacterium]|nr:hypothetical protein [Planctomycetales bacterium]
MDSQHRHELGENELAQWLTDTIDKLKPYASVITISVVGVVLIALAWGYLQKTSSKNEAAAWELYAKPLLGQAPDLGALENAVNTINLTEQEGGLSSTAGGAAAHWSSITLADGKLWQASVDILSDRQKGSKALDEAREVYLDLLAQKGVSAVIRDRAQLGLARSYEVEGDADKAVEEYKKVSGAFKEFAEERAADLDKPATRDSLAWLKTATAPRVTIPSGPGTPGEIPDFSPDAINTPDEADMEGASGDDVLSDILKDIEDQPAADVEEAADAAEATEDSPADSSTDSAEASDQQSAPGEAEDE